ncbi:MAG TPA: hypothetical protein VMG10_22985 [Gemmataceae bacterium]|nr:hypothetical protein [Gemmataceae bacterium]
MDMRGDVHDANQPAEDEPALNRLVSWVLQQIGLKSDGLPAFTDALLRAFRPAFRIPHPDAGEWFATLDTVDPQDNQVAALVRLSRQQPREAREVRSGMIAFEERGRKLFAEPASTNCPADSHLLLAYSFVLVFSLEDNLRLFREFAMNEIGRLRGTSETVHKT